MNAYSRLPANENRADLPMSVITTAALALPPLQQIELMRLLNGEFTWPDGGDDVDRGIDMIVCDLLAKSEAPTLAGYDQHCDAVIDRAMGL